jgi:prolyl-tRNA synthetase
MAKGLPKQSEDFPGWYVAVVKQADLAEHGLAKGSQIIKPYGYTLWENIQRALDDRFKATGHENFMFPALIPEKVIAREAEHVEGFSHEFWVVTHGGGQQLEEPLILRPTSEAVIWNAYANWIQSYRDLPLLYNQWCNVFRYELRTRLFLRTSEFFWQEGHTAHATRQEAWDEALQMLEIYRQVAEDVLAIPVLLGRKSESERFAGADETFPIEGLMRDGKALQCGTSHFLGQNFAKAYDVTFLNEKGEQEHAWGTSWGFTTRMVGGTVMAHGDDAGLRLPPAVAPIQVVIVPIYRSDDERGAVIETANRVKDGLVGNGVKVKIDDRDQYRPGFKFAEWELKGVPVRIEIGPKDVQVDQVVMVDRASREKKSVGTAEAITEMAGILDGIQKSLFSDAIAFRDDNTHEIESYDGFREGLEAEGGYWVGAWCGSEDCERKVGNDMSASIRVLPLEKEDPGAACAVCGQPGTERATWAKAY